MARVPVSTNDPNYAALVALRDAGFCDDYDVWLPQGGNPAGSTILRYIIVGTGIYWVPDDTYTEA